MSLSLSIRPLQVSELPEADRVFRLAFGTAAGLDDPLQMFGDAGYVHRWHLATGCAIAAIHQGQIIGTNFLARWGSLGCFGPLSVHPDYWNQGVASELMATTMAEFDRWPVTTVAFFTSAQSPKHLWFYSKFGFLPTHLTPVLTKAVTARVDAATRYSVLPLPQQPAALQSIRALTHALYPGLDLTAEIQLVRDHLLGETLLLWDEVGLAGVAICHYGAGTEGGSDNAYIKFGAARPGSEVEQRFEALLNACEGFAAAQQLRSLTAGVNTSRQDAYQRMLALGFTIRLVGVAMHQPAQRDYCRADVYALDDRR